MLFVTLFFYYRLFQYRLKTNSPSSFLAAAKFLSRSFTFRLVVHFVFLRLVYVASVLRSWFFPLILCHNALVCLKEVHAKKLYRLMITVAFPLSHICLQVQYVLKGQRDVFKREVKVYLQLWVDT